MSAEAAGMMPVAGSVDSADPWPGVDRLTQAQDGSPRDVAERLGDHLVTTVRVGEVVDAKDQLARTLEALADVKRVADLGEHRVDPDLAAACIAVAGLFARFAGWKVVPQGDSE